MYGQKYGPNLVKQLRIEKNKNRKTRSQHSTGIYFIDPDDQDYTETLKIGKTHGTSFALRKESSNKHHEGGLYTIHGRIVESHDPSMIHYKFVHKFILMPHAMKIRDAKAAADKAWKKLETLPAWQLEHVKSKKEVILEAQRDKKKVHLAAVMDTCHLKNAELEPKYQKYKGQSRAPR